MKKLKSILSVLMVSALLASCGQAPAKETPNTKKDTATEKTTEAKTEETKKEETPIGEQPYIAVISKGFQHQFWQTVMKGSNDAAEKYNVKITFEGPPTESDISAQVDMLNAALGKNPKAIALAALDTESVSTQLTQAKDSGIPIVGFDSGIPNAPEGTVVSTASTNNEEAGKLAATEMLKEPSFSDRLGKATTDNVVSIGVQSQEATSASLLGRTNGFINEMFDKCNAMYPGAVEVVGHEVFAKKATEPVVVSIKVTIPPSTSYTDAQAAAQTLLQNTNNLIGYFCSNEASVTGILAATNDGSDLDKENGKYKDLVVIGFDAGAPQKEAVSKKYFYGSVTQDPYQIGYLAVELAYKAINGDKLETMYDTGCKFYNSENMNNEDISILLYD